MQYTKQHVIRGIKTLCHSLNDKFSETNCLLLFEHQIMRSQKKSQRKNRKKNLKKSRKKNLRKRKVIKAVGKARGNIDP
eukprot:UN22895